MRRLAAFSFLILISSPSYAQINFGEYSEKRARQALNLAAAAYSSDPSPCLENTFPDKAYKVIAQKEKSCDRKNNLCSVFVAVSHYDKTIVVSFRGTATSRQLKLEMIESLKPEVDWYGYGAVDRYFYEAMNQLWPAIEEALAEPATSMYRVFFTGHSLGGALATLSTLKVYRQKLREPDLMHLFTFGEPRVGNKILANNVDRLITSSYRIVHAADIVPHLPPCKDDPKNRKRCATSDHRRAYHHGTEIWYRHGMGPGASYRICSNDDEDPNCSNGLGKYKINDHYYYFGVMVSGHGAAGCPTEIVTSTSARSLLFLPIVFLLLVV